MNRIAYMVLRNLFRAPIWFYHIWKLGRSGDTHTEQQRYDYIRNVVKNVPNIDRTFIAKGSSRRKAEQAAAEQILKTLEIK